MAHGVLAVLRDGGEAAREHGVMLCDVRGDFDAFAEPENGAGKVAGAQGLLGAGEALFDGFLGFCFFLAEGEGAGGGDLLVVGGALFVVDDGLVSDGEAAHQVLQQAEPFAMAHVAVGVKFAGHTMEIFFDEFGRGSSGDAEQLVVGGFAGEVEEGADFFLEFCNVVRIFGKRCRLRLGSSGDGCGLFGSGCRGWRCCWLGSLQGRLFHFLMLLAGGHADDRTENQQSIESRGGGILGNGAGCEEIFCGDRTRKRGEDAEFGIVELDSLVAQQRIGREVDAQAGVGGEMFQREILCAADGFEQELAERNGNADFGDDVFFKRAKKIEAAGRIVEDRGGDLR